MKKFLVVLMLASLVGCTSSTNHGECIGAFEDKDPAKIYQVSTWNIVLGAIFIETVFVPALVVLNQTHCPVGEKGASK